MATKRRWKRRLKWLLFRQNALCREQKVLAWGECGEGQQTQREAGSACFNLGSVSPCMAGIGWASMLDCRPVYSRLDGYKQRAEHQPPVWQVFSLFSHSVALYLSFMSWKMKNYKIVFLIALAQLDYNFSNLTRDLWFPSALHLRLQDPGDASGR